MNVRFGFTDRSEIAAPDRTGQSALVLHCTSEVGGTYGHLLGGGPAANKGSPLRKWNTKGFELKFPDAKGVTSPRSFVLRVPSGAQVVIKYRTQGTEKGCHCTFSCSNDGRIRFAVANEGKGNVEGVEFEQESLFEIVVGRNASWLRSGRTRINLPQLKVESGAKVTLESTNALWGNVDDWGINSSELSDATAAGGASSPSGTGASASNVRLVIFEDLCISSFPGRQFPGPVIQSLSLAPGETMTVSTSSYTKSNDEDESHRSVLDSTSSTTTENLSKKIMQQQQIEKEQSSDVSVGAEISAQATWGWGSASASVNSAADFTDRRREMTDHVSEGLREHISEASSQRQVEVKTTSRHSFETGSETAVTRELHNLNLSRPLDVQFRQVMQEVFSVVRLRDVRFALHGKQGSSRAPLERVGALIDAAFIDAEEKKSLKKLISTYLASFDTPSLEDDWELEDDREVPDTEGRGARDAQNDRKEDSQSFEDALKRLRARLRAPQRLVHHGDEGETVMTVRGIVLTADRHVVRTDSTHSEVQLGTGTGLDEYSTLLQKSETSLRLARTRIEEQRERMCALITNLSEKSLPNEIGSLAKAFGLASQSMPAEPQHATEEG